MKWSSPSRLVGWLAWVQLAAAHVVLTYPPARKYHLDFFDNSTSSNLCPMPPGELKTSLQSGKPFNVTWRLAYPHKGGYRLQLLDNLSRPVLDLTPVTSYSEFLTLDSTTNYLSVTIPSDFECENCTIRLVREANEWKDTRWFSSCADVNVKSKKTYRESCSGHGRYLLSKCRCDRLYYGENCQYKDECVEHADCGEVGRCVDLDSDSPIRKQCYCEVNWFGPSCAKRSKLKGSNIDLSGHMYKELGPNLKLYWRLMEEEGELEAVLVAKGTSYVALGWKPKSINSTCLRYPFTDPTEKENAEEVTQDLHPMECADMVIGSARGASFRIWDYYSRDRSTPQLDTYWGGKNDLTAAMGYEKDGMTTIAFRKKIKGTHPTDHSILNEEMTVIWARGQDKDTQDHWTDTEFENTPFLHNFYKDDELKYHGFKDHRGVLDLNFFEQSSKTESTQENQLNIISNCRGNWRHPKNCDPLLEECEYFAEWHYRSRTDLIHFSVSTKNSNLWTGIAFSNDHKMAKTDAVIAIVDKSGRPFIMDTWIVGTISPYLDINQDIQNVSMRSLNGVATYSFSRKRNTGDERDLAFTDEDCLYMMYPVKGGNFNAVNKNISPHKVTPSISSRRICIKACPASEEDLYASLEKTYLLEVKLANVGSDFQAPQVGTAEFESLSESVGGAFQRHLARYEKSINLEVKEFKQTDQDVLTTLELHLSDPSAESSVRKSIESAVARGKVGTILLDPSYWNYVEIKDKSFGDDDDDFHRNSVIATILESWIVLGCLSALILLILIQACCTICNRCGGPKNNQKSMPWKDYSSGGMNYDIDQIDLGEKIPGTLRAGYHQQKVPLSYMQNPKMHPGGSNNNLVDTKSLQRSKGNLFPLERSTHSLPRAPPQMEMQNGSYYTHRPHKNSKTDFDQVQPDFYFMPSQRKYSGEVVRVYVDYDNQNK